MFCAKVFSCALIFAFGSASGYAGEKEEVAKIGALGGKVIRNPEGEIDTILLFGCIPPLSDKDVESIDLAQFKHLKVFYACGALLTDRSLHHFAKITTKLETLNIASWAFSDKGVAALLKQQDKLENLALTSFSPMADQAMPAIGRLERLHSLSLSWTKVSDKGLRELQGSKGLVYLDLSDTNITDSGLREIVKAANIETLMINRTEVTDKGVKILRKLARLKALSLDGTNITDACVNDLATIGRLGRLSVKSTKLTRKGIDAILRSLPAVQLRK